MTAAVLVTAGLVAARGAIRRVPGPARPAAAVRAGASLSAIRAPAAVVTPVAPDALRTGTAVVTMPVLASPVVTARAGPPLVVAAPVVTAPVVAGACGTARPTGALPVLCVPAPAAVLLTASGPISAPGSGIPRPAAAHPRVRPAVVAATGSTIPGGTGRLSVGTTAGPGGPVLLSLAVPGAGAIIFPRAVIAGTIRDTHGSMIQKSGPPPHGGGPQGFNVGSDLLSHTLTSAVPSALEGLASGFGMEPGVPPPPQPPTTIST